MIDFSIINGSANGASDYAITLNRSRTLSFEPDRQCERGPFQGAVAIVWGRVSDRAHRRDRAHASFWCDGQRRALRPDFAADCVEVVTGEQFADMITAG